MCRASGCSVYTHQMCESGVLTTMRGSSLHHGVFPLATATPCCLRLKPFPSETSISKLATCHPKTCFCPVRPIGWLCRIFVLQNDLCHCHHTELINSQEITWWNGKLPAWAAKEGQRMTTVVTSSATMHGTRSKTTQVRYQKWEWSSDCAGDTDHCTLAEFPPRCQIHRIRAAGGDFNPPKSAHRAHPCLTWTSLKLLP